MITLYGIKNCDTVKKARKWLEVRGIEFRFHDFRTDGLEPANLDRWLMAVGWETLLNRRGTTWRQLDAAVREGINAGSARTLMLDKPTLIKRPVLELDGAVHVGFDAAHWAALFGG